MNHFRHLSKSSSRTAIVFQKLNIRKHYTSRRISTGLTLTSSNLFTSSSQSQPHQKFDAYIKKRRKEAEKSLLIQVSSLNSGGDIKNYLSNEFGPLESIYHYSVSEKSKHNTQTQSSSSFSSSSGVSSQFGQVHWILAEFKHIGDFHKALRSCRHAEGSLPYASSMCWFSQKLEGKNGRKPRPENDNEIQSELLVKGVQGIDFSKTKTLDQQIKLLESSLKVTEIGIRIRFLVARHLETCLEQFFPLGCVLPFGSTVSGIGRHGGDLDLILLPDKNEIFPPEKLTQSLDSSRLWYQSKLYFSGHSGNARFQVQRLMETLADVIQLFLPGCSQVQRILQARIPILRFWSEYTDLQCDLSMTNATGIHMSELIYIMTKLDPRFSSLLFTIRSWASARKITNPVPGRQPTNFMLVLMLVYFLQFKKILPTFDILFNNVGTSSQDCRKTADGIDCSFIRDPNRILKFFTPQNQDMGLSELLYDFFEFYSSFDFTTRGISLFTSSSWGKPDSGPLYIQNPLERHLNVARNVSKEETTRLKSECCSALWKLESTDIETNSNPSLTSLLLSNGSQSLELSQQLRLKDILGDK